MANRACPLCGSLFRGGDIVKATVLSEWIDLKSEVNYAIGKPTKCLDVVHDHCQFPRTGGPEGD